MWRLWGTAPIRLTHVTNNWIDLENHWLNSLRSYTQIVSVLDRYSHNHSFCWNRTKLFEVITSQRTENLVTHSSISISPPNSIVREDLSSKFLSTPKWQAKRWTDYLKFLAGLSKEWQKSYSLATHRSTSTILSIKTLEICPNVLFLKHIDFTCTWRRF